ncbi:MAG: ECF transporter S component [Anaerolineae bacterium]|nr:ECF transporter S component [Promineifilum sp.]MCZ2114068.1 ECF transporter S component [Anaerolineae bacterium]HNS38837.1 ECF transporter S component [Promineifilum sp.]
MSQKILTGALFVLAIVIGLVALAYPFIMRMIASSRADAAMLGSSEVPFLTGVLISLCLAVLLVELQGHVAGAKTVAALGIMIAVTSTLRFIEVGIPGPGGFSPIFAPIILGGYVFGPRFGFLLGAMTLLVSAVITAGVGPWLPYQMFTAGWIGLVAGGLPHPRRPRVEIALLIGFGFLWGFVYGFIMNLYTWPYLTGDPLITWTPGAGVAEAVRRYVAFYLTTSFLWDAAAAVGNVVLLAALGLPTIRALTRFRGRMQFQVFHQVPNP